MDESGSPPAATRLPELIEDGAHDDATARLRALREAAAGERKDALHALNRLATDRPETVTPLLSTLEPFLTDDERAVRLTTTKLFVAVAEAVPEAVVPTVPALAARLDDDSEFYYVRARSAETLGYVALDHPDAAVSPGMLANLRVGLSFDESEVTEKLAKALECVALGDPTRLEHHVSALADHLDDENALVRYHLCTAMAAVGCARPAAVADVRPALVDRLGDERPAVRGRAAEALGVLARAGVGAAEPALDDVATEDDSFAAARARFARQASGDEDRATDDELGTLAGLRDTTADAVAALTAPDGDGECPHCGASLPETGPPTCPGCGAPR